MSDLTYADSLKDEGNYQQAIDEYKKQLSVVKGLRAKADINQKIKAAERFYHSAINVSAGEVFFPVVNTAASRGIILTGKVSLTEEDGLPDSWNKSWEKIKRLTANFLDDYLYKEIRTVMVLDWGIGQYKFSVKKVPNSSVNITELADGASIELAMFMALMSFILNQRLGNAYAFTGEVNDHGFSVGYVEGIKEKTEAIKLERKMVKTFIVPGGAKKDKVQKEVSSLKEVVKIAFPTFEKIIKNKQAELGIKRITLTTYKTITKDKKQHCVIKFNQPQGIKENEALKIYEFIKNNADNYLPNEGAIIDGLFITYALPMLASLREVNNHVPNFLACRYGARPGDDGYAHAFVIRTKNSGGTRQVGEHFEYKVNPVYEG